jgi:hypothetical protein
MPTSVPIQGRFERDHVKQIYEWSVATRSAHTRQCGEATDLYRTTQRSGAIRRQARISAEHLTPHTKSLPLAVGAQWPGRCAPSRNRGRGRNVFARKT